MEMGTKKCLLLVVLLSEDFRQASTAQCNLRRSKKKGGGGWISEAFSDVLPVRG